MDARRKLTKVELEEAIDTFNLVADGCSSFDINRLHIALQSLGLSTKIDQNKSFEDTITVDLETFLAVVCTCVGDPNWALSEIQEAFTIFDREESGVLEKNDLRRVFTKLGEILSDKDLDNQFSIEMSEESSEKVESTAYGREAHILAEDFVFLCKNTDGKDYESNPENDG